MNLNEFQIYQWDELTNTRVKTIEYKDFIRVWNEYNGKAKDEYNELIGKPKVPVKRKFNLRRDL